MCIMRTALALWLICLLAAPLWAADALDFAQRILAANVLVDRGCSGTIVHLQHRLVLTAHHCVREKITLEEREERAPDGTYKKIKRERLEDVSVGQVRYQDWRVVGEMSFDTKLIAWDRERDLALLQFHSTTLPFEHAARFPPAEFAEASLMPVVVVGNPRGEENTITAGVVANTNRIREVGYPAQRYRYIQLDVVIAPGSSGGAVYHAEQGFYFAMAAAGYRDVPINFAIPWRVIREFLTAHCWQELYEAQAADRETCLAAQREQAPHQKALDRGE